MACGSHCELERIEQPADKILSLAGPVGRQRVKDDYLCEWKQPTLAPRGVETLNPISMQFGRGDYVNKLNKRAKFEIDRTKSGAATGS